MTKLCRRSILLVLSVLFYLPSYAIAVGPPTVLNFDDVPAPADFILVPMPAGYGGVNWPDNVGIYGNFQPPYNAQSPPNRVVFNFPGIFELPSSETLVTFVDGPKIFNGAYFSGYFEVHFNLYSGATLVGTSSILDLGPPTVSGGGSGPTFLASGYAGPVDKVGIYGRPGKFVMDDFTFEQVPEPSTALLLAISAISILGRRKRS